MKKQKPQMFIDGDEELYGYQNPIVYNEIREGAKLQVNTDTNPLEKNLHSPEALAAAAKSLEGEL